MQIRARRRYLQTPVVGLSCMPGLVCPGRTVWHLSGTACENIATDHVILVSGNCFGNHPTLNYEGNILTC